MSDQMPSAGGTAGLRPEWLGMARCRRREPTSSGRAGGESHRMSPLARVGLVALAACGGGDDTAENEASPVPSPPAETTTTTVAAPTTEPSSSTTTTKEPTSTAGTDGNPLDLPELASVRTRSQTCRRLRQRTRLRDRPSCPARGVPIGDDSDDSLGLPASEQLQIALRAELERQDALDETERYLAELSAEVGEPNQRRRSHADVIARRIRDRSLDRVG